jgi:sterol desaturase/sphingolipid hydroxylase (fatty acid hydroxylase superfamily)
MCLLTFFKINILIICIAHAVSCVHDIFMRNCLRTLLLVTFLSYGTRYKQTISTRQSYIEPQSLLLYFTLIMLFDTMFHETYSFSTKSWSIFPLMLFGYELIFDFFHYCLHRLCHEIPFLYKHVHKSHHRHIHPSIWSTFYIHPFDYLLTNLIPHKIAMSVVYQFITGYEYELILAYKMYIELAGHSGILTNAPSFPIFPTLFGYALQTIDHDLHHSRPDLAGNYSKRFRIWDCVFGTWIRGQ